MFEGFEAVEVGFAEEVQTDLFNLFADGGEFFTELIHLVRQPLEAFLNEFKLSVRVFDEHTDGPLDAFLLLCQDGSELFLVDGHGETVSTEPGHYSTLDIAGKEREVT